MKFTHRKSRKGETIEMRADEGEDLRGVIEAMVAPVPEGVVSDGDEAQSAPTPQDPTTAQLVAAWNLLAGDVLELPRLVQVRVLSALIVLLGIEDDVVRLLNRNQVRR